jgi:hypothetical protein
MKSPEHKANLHAVHLLALDHLVDAGLVEWRRRTLVPRPGIIRRLEGQPKVTDPTVSTATILTGRATRGGSEQDLLRHRTVDERPLTFGPVERPFLKPEHSVRPGTSGLYAWA